MEVLFHFVFELIKIAILSSIYALVILFLLKGISRYKTKKFFDKIISNNVLFWFISGVIISILQFFWMFSYSGSHGLGDYARIPLGHNKEVQQMNGDWTFISPKGYEYEKFRIYSFALKGNYFVGQKTMEAEKYYIWNLRSNEIESINSKEEYRVQANELNLPEISEFKKFYEMYNKYWGGWRFWLLP